jgi:hypothetical protein
MIDNFVFLFSSYLHMNAIRYSVNRHLNGFIFFVRKNSMPLLINQKNNLFSWIYIYVLLVNDHLYRYIYCCFCCCWSTSHSNQANNNRFLTTSLIETTILTWSTKNPMNAYASSSCMWPFVSSCRAVEHALKMMRM